MLFLENSNVQCCAAVLLMFSFGVYSLLAKLGLKYTKTSSTITLRHADHDQDQKGSDQRAIPSPIKSEKRLTSLREHAK